MAAFLASPDAEYRIARWERDRQVCHFHGGPVSECVDDERDWFAQRSICWPTAQKRAAERRYHLLHREKPYHNGFFEVWTKEPTEQTPFHYTDGVTIWMADVNLAPDDDWLEQREAESTATAGDE